MNVIPNSQNKQVSTSSGLRAALAAADAEIYITITDSFAINETFGIQGGKTVHLHSDSAGYALSRGNGFNGTLFQVNSGGTLELSGIILDGAKDVNSGSLALIQNSGSLILSDGAVLRNNSVKGNGGGIYNVNGNITLNGGVIEENTAGGTGGGIFFSSTNGGKTLTISDQTKIMRNKAKSGGGIFFSASVNEKILMSGSSQISGNNAASDGGGIYLSRGTLEMSGGTIGGAAAGNTAQTGGGVYLDSTEAAALVSGTAKISGNRVSENGGGFFADAGKITMTGGAIGGTKPGEGNTAQNGGGIAVGNDSNVTTIEISGDGKIAGNTALSDGGGMYLMTYSAASVTMSGQALLQNNEAERNGGGIYAQGDNPYTEHQPRVSLNGTVRVIGNRSVKGDGGGVWIDYPYLSYLDVAAGVVFSNNTASAAYQIADQDKPLYKAHVHAQAFSSAFEYGYNNYDIRYTKGSAITDIVNTTISAVKLGVGAEIAAGQFSFGLFDSANRLLAEKSNDASGLIRFNNALSFIAPGTFTYYVKEITSGGGWTADPTVFPVKIIVVSSAGKKLTPFVDYPNGIPVFKNISEKDAQGRIAFSCLKFSAPGVYEYSVREDTASGNGWTADPREYPMIVTVTDDGSGNLLPSISYPKGYPEFIDTYKASPASAIITASKRTVGKALSGNEFEFGLFDENGTLTAVSANDADGNISFPAISYNEAGEHRYTVRELTPSGNGWTVGGEEYSVDVKVTADSTGKITAKVSYPNGSAEFRNTYAVKPVTICPSANKKAVGAPMATGQFKFGVYDASGAKVASGVNAAAGAATNK